MRIAVIGAGISGLGAAYVLSRRHEVTLLEREPRLGGHANTVSVEGPDGPLALDTGFIVHNGRTYPLLVRLLGELGVRTRESRMSFSVTCERCGIEYSGAGIHRQPRALLSARHRRLLTEVASFLRRAPATLDGRFASATIGEYLDREGYSRSFGNHYLVPLVGAVWSSAPGSALEMPAEYALRFMDNHGMLGFRRLRWRTVEGGSGRYVAALVERLGASVRPGVPVASLSRRDDGVTLRLADGALREVDAVVVATHADQALALLEDPSADERRLLGAFGYTANDTVLHTDPSLLPGRRARASWNVHTDDCRSPQARPTLTYHLNSLQRIAGPPDYCVTLNRTGRIDPDRILRQITYEHPVYTFAALRAQADLPRLNGVRRTAFAGAYHGYGFHEDGLAAGVAAARAFGAQW